MGRKKWNVLKYDKQKALSLAQKTGADEFAVLLMLTRGTDTPEKIEEFLNCSAENLSDPFLAADMEKGVERIRTAIDNDEKILVYGDYDCDGVTATALLYTYLLMQGADADYYIPSRVDEGYGLSYDSAAKIVEGGFSLVVTVDNGIAAIEEAAFLKENGIDMVVTDHHTPGDTLPDCCAVIDPHREDDRSPYKDTAGVGVAAKLAAALEYGDYSAILEDFGDLIAIGTIADIVPLTGENRILVADGLSRISNTSRPGLLALMNELSVDTDSLVSSTVAYMLAPKINAAGRMDTADKALRLLITDDENEAASIISDITSANTARQSAESAILSDIASVIEEHPGILKNRVLVFSGRNWHPGVIGIAAARLTEKYGKPCAVISIDSNGIGKGSARSIEGFSLYEALCSCSDSLIKFGGHKLAAGFSVKEELIDEFTAKFNAVAAGLAPFFPVLNIDCRLNPAYITTDVLDSISVLEPMGAENPSPVFGLFDMQITSVRGIGGNKHIRLTLQHKNSSVPAVFFGMTPENFGYRQGDTVDVAVKLEKNEYMGRTNVSVQVKDIRPAGSDDELMFSSLSAYENALRGDELTAEQKNILLPDRQVLGSVFKFIKENSPCALPAEIICMRLGLSCADAGKVSVCLEALAEVGVLLKTPEGFADAKINGKADISQSEILGKLR